MTTQSEEKVQHLLKLQEELNVPSHFYSTPDQFLEFALDSTLALVEAHAGSLFLWDESQKALVLKASRGPYLNRADQIRIRLREGVSGWVGDHGRSVLVKDIEADDRFQQIRRSGQYKTNSFMSLPLIASNKLLGVINITERENLNIFQEKDFEFARIFARYVGIAFENMRLAAKYRIENEQLNDRLMRTEQTLKEQEPLVSLGRLAANLAHELNNPLDSIRRYVNLALDQVMEDSVARQYILNAKEGVRRAVQVIRGLLQYSRETARLERRESEVHHVIQNSLECVAKDHDFSRIAVSTCFHAPSARVTDCGLSFVFRNLLKNAHHAMKGEGALTITTHLDNEKVLIEVSDTGGGIPDHVKRRMFEPFFSTKKEQGTGIGLIICREIVEKCGGTITFDSEVGVGTRFLIQLPCKTKEL